VLKHVQVERYFISRRYRVGAVTIGPQLSVDAGERQITMDRSLQSLPASLQAVSLYETKGELVDAAGGVLEFSDLLKRPLDAFKYLQLSIETGEVALTAQNVQLNCVMIGSANELHLDAFREHTEFPSFRGRLELARVPYLKSYEHERLIYDTQVAPHVRRHVAPHATEMAGLFAVLTRMRKPNPDRYARTLGAIVSTLTAVEKADLYALGKTPERLDAESQKTLRAATGEVWEESDAYPIYEGRIGVSPREMRIALLDAAQSSAFRCLNPVAVVDEIDALCQRKNEFEWLQQDAIAGGYHDVKTFRDTLNARLYAASEYELYVSSGLVQEEQYAELLDRYVQHVSAWVKKERLYNRVTRQYEEPDEATMGEVERLLDIRAEPSDVRGQIIGAIAAWAIEHPGQKVDAGHVFPQHLRRMREAIFSDKRQDIAGLARDVVILVREEAAGLDAERKKRSEAAIERMTTRFGYCRDCASDACSMLLRKRFQDLTV
jgi:serine protein kinase